MSTLYNRVRVGTATTGTGTVTLGAATANNYFTFAEAGVPDAAVVSYVIEDGTDVEFGIGTYTSAGTTLSRDTVTASKISGTAGTSKINLSGSAVVFLTALAADITVPPASSTDNALARFNGTSGKAIQNGDVILSDDGLLSLTKSFNGAIGFDFDNTHTDGNAAFLLTHSDSGNEFQGVVNQFGSYIGSNAGNAALGTFNSPDQFFLFTANEGRLVILETGEVGIIDDWATAIDPTRKFQISHTNAATNTVVYLQRYHLESSGSPAAGLGVGMEFAVETAAGNVEIGATVEAVTTDVTSTSEDFDLVFKAMAAGAAAAERFRIKSTNRLVSPSGQVAHFWVYWTGGSTTILASHNVTSIDNDATGDAGINLTTAFSSNNYAAFVQTNDTTNGWDGEEVQASGINVHTSSTVDVLCSTITDGTTAAAALNNPDQWQAVGFGVSA